MKQLLIKTITCFAGFMVLIIVMQGCNNATKTPQPSNEEEVITTMKVEMKDSVTTKLLNFYFRDLDRLGTAPPTQWDTIKLSPNSIYTVAMKFLNESNPNSVVDFTGQIYAEQKNHIICFEPVGANLTVIRTDRDTTYEVGLASKWKTGATSSGKITISLKHQPGVKDGTCSPGSTDAEVVFPLIIK